MKTVTEFTAAIEEAAKLAASFGRQAAMAPTAAEAASCRRFAARFHRKVATLAAGLAEFSAECALYEDGLGVLAQSEALLEEREKETV